MTTKTSKEYNWEHKIVCSNTVESLRPCIVCLTLTRHRHKVEAVAFRGWSTGGTAICEDCCKDPGVKSIPPGVRDSHLQKMIHCKKCGYLGPDKEFKKFKASPWMFCPNCNAKKNQKALDRFRTFLKVFVVAREFREDDWLVKDRD